AVMHVQDPIPRLPPHLRHWQPFIDRALAKSPGHRFADAAQMLDALERVPSRARSGVRGALDRALLHLGALPKPTWIAIGAVAVAVLGTAVWMERRATVPGFYRAVDGGPAAQPAAATPSAIAAMGAAGSVDDALLRAAPASDAERWLVAAERQLRAGRLTAPPGDNAYTSLLNAWQADSGHPRVGPAIDALIEALAARAERDVASGEPAAARTAVMQANQPAHRTARAD